MIIAIAWIISILLTALVVWLVNDSAAHQRGYKSGYDTGDTTGYKRGYKCGYENGDAGGYERGRKDGVAAEQALQSLHRETIAALSTPPAAQKPPKFHKRAAEGKKGNGRVRK